MIESYFRNGHQEENGAWVHQIEPAFQEFKENFPNFSNLKHIIVNCCLFIYLLLLHYLFTHIARIYLLLWVRNFNTTKTDGTSGGRERRGPSAAAMSKMLAPTPILVES
jgi:hypothetical protein